MCCFIVVTTEVESLKTFLRPQEERKQGTGIETVCDRSCAAGGSTMSPFEGWDGRRTIPKFFKTCTHPRPISSCAGQQLERVGTSKACPGLSSQGYLDWWAPLDPPQITVARPTGKRARRSGMKRRPGGIHHCELVKTKMIQTRTGQTTSIDLPMKRGGALNWSPLASLSLGLLNEVCVSATQLVHQSETVPRKLDV